MVKNEKAVFEKYENDQNFWKLGIKKHNQAIKRELLTNEWIC